MLKENLRQKIDLIIYGINYRAFFALIGIDKAKGFCYNALVSKSIKYNGVWLSLVERLVRDQEAVGSNPATPTRKRQVSTETCRFQLYSPYGELYAPSVRDICFSSDMPVGVRRI